jgi:hypothetical protein
MSDVGLFGGKYEQLRSYANKLDLALIALRSPQNDQALKARQEIVSFLREIADHETTNPTSRLIAVLLKQDLPQMVGQTAISGQSLAICEGLAKKLEKSPPSEIDLNQLECIAMLLDKECSRASTRIRG